VLRLLPNLIPVGLKVIEKYWAKDVLRNQALGMILAVVQSHSSALHRELLLDLNGVSIVSRQVFAVDIVCFWHSFFVTQSHQDVCEGTCAGSRRQRH
jgi:hypothetical protein